MRTIKFRGKRLDGEWAYGFYLETQMSGVFILGSEIETKKRKDGITMRDKLWQHEVIPESVGQYVPREDFYEGDVLYGEDIDEFGNRIGRWYGTVKYDEDSGRIRIKEHFGDWYETDDFDYQEIIGNIHDNPELMEVE